MKEVRTRFAPSPTGFLHIGGLRTAAYAWLLARNLGGTFVLRIEDTDQERRVKGAIRGIYEELAWVGITVDEGPTRAELQQLDEDWEGAPETPGPYGPYTQSLRLPRYQELAEQLVTQGVAYRCDCTAEMLEQERNEQMARKEVPGYSGYCRTRNVSKDVPHVIRFKLPVRSGLSFTDGIRGKIVWDSISLKDPVILKSDRFPTYNFAVVVDDHDMKISHVMRGEEFISTTPIHLLLYEALGWEPPVIAHLPVVLGTDGKKLSKRQGSTFTSQFRENGYLPEAIRNFIVLVGWSPGKGEEQEVFTEKELIERFSLEGINQASGVFDDTKLLWMNGMYMRSLPDQEFIRLAKPFLERAGLVVDDAKFAMVAPLVKERVRLLTEIAPMVDFLFVDKIEREIPLMFKKGMDKVKALEVLDKAEVILSGIPDWKHDLLDAALRTLASELGLKVGVMLGVLRIAITGKEVTPPLFESLEALGRETTLARMKEGREMVAAFEG